jgi:hypothetical protein
VTERHDLDDIEVHFVRLRERVAMLNDSGAA